VSVEGLRVLKSRHDPGETMDRLEAALRRHGFKILVRIDHAEEARAAGVELRPTVVVMFGSALAGAPTVRTTPTLAIDLPIRVLIWQDEQEATWAAYNDPVWLLGRHGLASAAAVEVMNEVLANVVGEAVA